MSDLKLRSDEPIETGLMLVANSGGDRVNSVNILARASGFVPGVKEAYKAASFKFKSGGGSGDVWYAERPKFIPDVLPYLRDNLFTTPNLFHLVSLDEMSYFRSSLCDGRVDMAGVSRLKHFSEYEGIFGFNLDQLHNRIPEEFVNRLKLS